MKAAGHDAIHVRDVGLESATDEEIFELAQAQNRVIVSADTDFGSIVALRYETKPSIILLRRSSSRRPLEQAALLLENLPMIQPDLDRGCVSVFEETRIRIRRLPIGGSD